MYKAGYVSKTWSIDFCEIINAGTTIKKNGMIGDITLVPYFRQKKKILKIHSKKLFVGKLKTTPINISKSYTTTTTIKKAFHATCKQANKLQFN